METRLNNQIKDWWYALPDLLRGNMPTFIHPLNKNAQILFVGLNPSGDTSAKPPITEISDVDIKQKIELEKIAIWGNSPNRNGQYKRYYKPISDIADELDVEFEHCDLFQMSYRTAKVVVNELLNSDKVLKPIHNKHLSVFYEIYKFVAPKVVISNNVVSADIIKGYMDLQFEKQTGLYINSDGVYFYLNGIMSYGRQTRYDRERLIWQVKNLL